MGAAAGMDLAPKLITASLMAAPGALVIAKIVFPETQESQTMGTVKLEVKSDYSNVIDAVSHGSADGFKIAMNVIAMLIGFIAVIACICVADESAIIFIICIIIIEVWFRDSD